MKDSAWKFFGIQHPSGFERRCLDITTVGGRRKCTALFQSIVFHMGRGRGSDCVEQDATAIQDDRVGQTALHKNPAESGFLSALLPHSLEPLLLPPLVPGSGHPLGDLIDLLVDPTVQHSTVVVRFVCHS